MTRLLGLAVASASVVLGLLPGSAMAAEGGGCQLSGTANFAPGLTSTAQNFSYSFSGSLTNCQSSSGGPATGQVFAGTNGLPAPTGSGSCGSSTTSGVAVVQWADATTTVVQYSTTGALAAVALQGTVIPSAGTFTTTRYAGADALGGLVFHPADPTGCVGAGVTSAAIDGFVGLGSS
jgi:hypothetical protein